MNEFRRKKANARRKKRSTEDPAYRARRAEISRASYRRNRDRVRLRRLARRRSDPTYLEKVRMISLERRWREAGFGSITQWYERMLKLQNGRCAICKRRSDRRLHVDHCHAMNMLRSLLCRRCNTGLGMLGEDANRLREAAAYLDMWRIIHAADAASGREKR